MRASGIWTTSTGWSPDRPQHQRRVPAGASAFEPVFLTDDLTEVDVAAVEEIQIGLHVLDNDSGETIWQGVGTLHP